MRVATAVEVVVGVTHRLGAAAAEHDLHIDRLQPVVLEAVYHPGWAGEAFPRRQLAVDAAPGLVLEEDRQIALQDEEHLLDLVGMRRIALAGRHEHDAESEAARRDDARVVVLAGAAGADEAVL